MNIILLSLSRIDDIQQKGIYSDLVRKFAENHHNIWIVTPREIKENVSTSLSDDGKVHYLKVKIGNIRNVNLIEKGISTISLESVILNSIKKYLSDIKFDLILFATPPITFYNIVKFIKNRDGAKSYLMLKDIFPQNSVDLNMMNSKSLLYRYFRRKEKKLYEISDIIGCMSPANKEYLIDNNPNLDPSKIELLPNSLEPQSIKVDPNTKIEVREKYGIPLNKKVFLYGGNLGKPQGIHFLQECILENEKNAESFILVVGKGTEFIKLKQFFIENDFKNAMLLSSLPAKEYQALANSMDVGLIFLDYRFSIPNFPSRLLSYMQASMPVIVASDPNTDMGTIVEEGNFGFKCLSNDVHQFINSVNKMVTLNDYEFNKMGLNARKYFEKNYTTEQSYKIIMKHFS